MQSNQITTNYKFCIVSTIIIMSIEISTRVKDNLSSTLHYISVGHTEMELRLPDRDGEQTAMYRWSTDRQTEMGSTYRQTEIVSDN